MPEFEIPKPAVATKSLTLPSGKVMVYREAKGLDLMKAQSIVGVTPDAMAIVFAIIARVATIDGQPVLYEDILEMPLSDVIPMQTVVLGENFTIPPLPVLPDSSTSGSALPN
jgi:hypothetical protein